MEHIEIVEVSPFQCRLWKYHDRLPEYVNESSCREEITSIRKNGQQQPVLGRALNGDPEFSMEIIFGSRRLFACRHLGVPIRVHVCEMSDREALVAMDVENRLRRDLSPYERGMGYVQWLRDGAFGSQRELATALNVSVAQVCKLIKFAEIPAVIINAFPSPLEIKETWALTLTERLADEKLRARMIATARNISRRGKSTPALAVYEELLGTAPRPKQRKRTGRIEVVQGDDGTALFKLLHRVDNLHIVIPKGVIDSPLTEQLKQAVGSVLAEQIRNKSRRSPSGGRRQPANKPKDAENATAL